MCVLHLLSGYCLFHHPYYDLWLAQDRISSFSGHFKLSFYFSHRGTWVKYLWVSCSFDEMLWLVFNIQCSPFLWQPLKERRHVQSWTEMNA